MNRLLCAVLLVCVSGPAGAVVLKDTFGAGTGFDPDALSIDMGASSEFMGVAVLYHSDGYTCSGSLISTTAVLTARHCTNGLAADGWGAYFGANSSSFQGYDVRSVSSLAGDPSAPDDFFNGTDLAVLHLSTAVSGIDPIEVLTETAYVETVAIVGYGRHGTGTTGDSERIDWNRRFATNTYEVFAAGYEDNVTLWADFDKEDGSENTLADLGYFSTRFGTEFEGMMGSGDSGGPLLFERDGEWVIGGVATGIQAYDGVADDSDYGDIGIWTSIQSDAAIALITDAGGRIYRTAMAPVPLPAPVYALGVALCSLMLLGQRRA